MDDSGYDGPRLAFLLADLPVQLLVRLRSDRVMRLPVPAREPARAGRPARHGPEVRFADPGTWPEPAHTTTTPTTRYGTAVARAFDRLHPRLARRGAWADHDGDLPILEGTVIRLQVAHLPGDADPAGQMSRACDDLVRRVGRRRVRLGLMIARRSVPSLSPTVGRCNADVCAAAVVAGAGAGGCGGGAGGLPAP